jgi:predicted O-methyltransferase YrrM
MMSSRSLGLTDEVYTYLLENSLRESITCRALRKKTETIKYNAMQISPEQGQFMSFLVSLLNVKKAIEVGTYTGYSTLCVAQSLPADGKVIACDISEEWTRIGQHYWEEADLSDKIDLRIGPAVDTLESLKDEAGTFDFGFIDADKVNYLRYYELILQLLRPGGLVLIDNVLWSGSVADKENQEESTCAIRALNSHIHADERVQISMLPVGDGLTLVRKL